MVKCRKTRKTLKQKKIEALARFLGGLFVLVVGSWWFWSAFFVAFDYSIGCNDEPLPTYNFYKVIGLEKAVKNYYASKSLEE